MKGIMLSQFHVGQRVSFATACQDARTGRLVKLHKSCHFGVAEIRPDDGSKKLARRLQHVSAI